jgi:hypothetical protein
LSKSFKDDAFNQAGHQDRRTPAAAVRRSRRLFSE